MAETTEDQQIQQALAGLVPVGQTKSAEYEAAQIKRLASQSDIDQAALGLRREQMNLDAELQRSSLDLQAKVKRGEMSLQQALGRQDRLIQQAKLQQQERIAKSQALAQARQLQLQAAPWTFKKGQQFFPGFEPTGLASQIAQRFGMKFDAPEITPIEFTPMADVEKTFAGADLQIPDMLQGLDFSFIQPNLATGGNALATEGGGGGGGGFRPTSGAYDRGGTVGGAYEFPLPGPRIGPPPVYPGDTGQPGVWTGSAPPVINPQAAQEILAGYGVTPEGRVLTPEEQYQVDLIGGR